MPETTDRIPSAVHKILIVDDDQDFLEILREALAPRFKVTTCSDSNVALDIAREDRPDLMVLDLLMPFPSGVRLLQEYLLDKDLQRASVLVMTGSREPELVGQVSRRFKVLQKPFELSTLHALLDEMLAARE